MVGTRTVKIQQRRPERNTQNDDVVVCADIVLLIIKSVNKRIIAFRNDPERKPINCEISLTTSPHPMKLEIQILNEVIDGNNYMALTYSVIYMRDEGYLCKYASEIYVILNSSLLNELPQETPSNRAKTSTRSECIFCKMPVDLKLNISIINPSWLDYKGDTQRFFEFFVLTLLRKYGLNSLRSVLGSLVQDNES